MLIPGDSRPPEIEWWPTMLRNTYTRGATAPVTAMGRLNNVSIHAPTRGATSGAGHVPLPAVRVSIHAPTRGATVSMVFFPLMLLCFNPRTHTGCDLQDEGHGQHYAVSIHAPTRGATQRDFPHPFGQTSFNPRTHTGCDSGQSLMQSKIAKVSIHAPTRGATDPARLTSQRQGVSIHAPTRGAT